LECGAQRRGRDRGGSKPEERLRGGSTQGEKKGRTVGRFSYHRRSNRIRPQQNAGTKGVEKREGQKPLDGLELSGKIARKIGERDFGIGVCPET